MQSELDLGITESTSVFEFKDLGKDARSFHPIACFVDGQAAGWVFSVGRCHREALDLRTVDIIRNKQPYTVESQGRSFRFAEGCVFHIFGGTLPHAKLTIQIDSAVPAGNVLEETVTTDGACTVKTLGATTLSEKRGRIRVTTYKYDAGYVKFTVYRPRPKPVMLVEKNDDGEIIAEYESAFEKVSQFETTQADLVTLLQTGLLISKKGVIDLLKENEQRVQV